jgi:hypothetical protein
MRTLQSIELGLLRPLQSKSTGETPARNSERPQGTIAACREVMDEHRDDLEPEVEEGAEFETHTYAPEAFEDDVADAPDHEGQGDPTAEEGSE